MATQRGRPRHQLINTRSETSLKSLGEIDRQAEQFDGNSSSKASIAQHRRTLSPAGFIHQATTPYQRPSSPALTISTQTATSNLIREVKAKRQSMLNKLASSAAAALSQSQNDLSKVFTADYFPQDPPRELEGLQSRDIEKLVDALIVQLQLHFHEPLDRQYNGQLARVLEYHAAIRDQLSASEKQNVAFAELLAEANENLRDANNKLEDLKELYLTEIKRMELKIAEMHGLQTVTLMRSNTILGPQDRKPHTTKTVRDGDDDGPSSTKRSSKRLSMLSRDLSPTRHDAALSANLRGSAILNNAQGLEESFRVGTPDLREPARRRTYLKLTSKGAEQSVDVHQPTGLVIANVSLPLNWADPTPLGIDDDGYMTDEDECFGGDLLPDELDNAVLAMKTDQSADASAIRRTAQILANRKHMTYESALRSFVEILFGTLDVEYLGRQAARNQGVKEPAEMPATYKPKKARGWGKRNKLQEGDPKAAPVPKSPLFPKVPGKRDDKGQTPGVQRHRPKSSSFPEKLEPSKKENGAQGELGIQRPSSRSPSGYASEPDSRPTSFYEGDDGAVIGRETIQPLADNVGNCRKERPKAMRGATSPSMNTFSRCILP